MRILILGAGAREHALAWRLGLDPEVSQVIVGPGNPGIRLPQKAVPLDILDPEAVLETAIREAVDLTVVGPEAALEAGVVDRFQQAGRLIVGPRADVSALECSKAFAKRLMEAEGVPTARFAVCETPGDALAVLKSGEFGFPVVIKADGLAAGKGVVIARDEPEATAAIHAAMVASTFGAAGHRVVIEECLSGPEVSVFVLTDGRSIMPLGSAQDHKRVFDDDEGPNTGGMGAFAPSPLMTPALADQTIRRVVTPVLDHFARAGQPYTGFLYVSLMLTADGPRVIEFNVRLGDPETQVILPLLEGSLAPALEASARGGLHAVPPLRVGDRRAVGVVLASAGYPASSDPGRGIDGVEAAEDLPDTLVFHAGTRADQGRLVTAGGRVLTVVGRGSSFAQAIDRAYAGVRLVRFQGQHFRRDIGRRAVDFER